MLDALWALSGYELYERYRDTEYTQCYTAISCLSGNTSRSYQEAIRDYRDATRVKRTFETKGRFV